MRLSDDTLFTESVVRTINYKHGRKLCGMDCIDVQGEEVTAGDFLLCLDLVEDDLMVLQEVIAVTPTVFVTREIDSQRLYVRTCTFDIPRWTGWTSLEGRLQAWRADPKQRMDLEVVEQGRFPRMWTDMRVPKDFVLIHPRQTHRTLAQFLYRPGKPNRPTWTQVFGF